MPSSGTELIELVTQALAHPQFSSTNQTVRLLQTAQASGDNSSTSIVNNFFFWAINITLMAIAVSLIIWCCKYNGAGQFSAWLNGGITSDQQHARNVMLRREKEANARRLSPAQQRKLLKRIWEQNNVCMVVNKTDLVLGEESPDENDAEQGPPMENTDNSSGYLCLRLATGLNRIVPNCCTICLGPYEVGESVVWSSNPECLHCFHEECVTDWFIKMQDGSPCPCCRQAFTNIEDERNKTQVRWAPGSTMNISVITI